MVINEECKKCQIKRNVDKYPDNVTKEEIKTSTGYVNFVTDGYNEYRIISSKPQGLTTYDKILVSGNIDRNTNRITNASIIKEK
mgnify:CR=1 FL=1